MATRGRAAVGSLPLLRTLPIRWRILLARGPQRGGGGRSSRASSGTARRSYARPATSCGRRAIPTGCWRCWKARRVTCKASFTAISRSPMPICSRRSRICATALLGTLNDRASVDPILSGSAAELVQATERFVAGFSDLREVQDDDRQYLREPSARAGARDGRPLRHRGRRHTGSDGADLAGAEQIARIVFDDARAHQRLLPDPGRATPPKKSRRTSRPSRAPSRS